MFKEASLKNFKEPSVSVTDYAKRLAKLHGKEGALKLASKYANEKNQLTDNLTKNFFTLVIRELK